MPKLKPATKRVVSEETNALQAAFPGIINYDQIMPPLDLVDEADWEANVEFVSLEEAGLEEDHEQPIFGLRSNSGSLYDYLVAFYDGDDVEIHLT